MRIERMQERIAWQVSRCVKRNDLSEGVRSGVSPAGPDHPHILLRYCEYRLFERALHRYLTWLPLESGIRRAHVLDAAANSPLD